MRDALSKYLQLEALMRQFDAEGLEVLAEQTREMMDTIWYHLNDSEHRELNARNLSMKP